MCEELQQTLAERPEDVERICVLARRVGDLRQQELVRLVRSIAEVRRTLTVEQRQLLEKFSF